MRSTAKSSSLLVARALLSTLYRYGFVGLLAAGLHAFLLLSLSALGFYLPLANLAAFLGASAWSFVAHSKFSFKPQTGGRLFARRWLVLQLFLNVLLSLLLPLALGPLAPTPAATVLLVFTPTFVNFVVWSWAARHTAHLHGNAPSDAHAAGTPQYPEQHLVDSPVDQSVEQSVVVHADDLGLAEPINRAIFELFDRRKLDSASLMVAAPALEHALAEWRKRPSMRLCLHLVLTEGPASAPLELIPDLVDRAGQLRLGFGYLLLFSFLPGFISARLVRQLMIEIGAQISRFQELTGITDVSLDGHQHVHLIPIVWRSLLALPPSMRPTWIRSIREPWPSGLSWKLWLWAIFNGGVLKSLVLRGLNTGIESPLAAHGIRTNSSFAGVIFTGCMAGPALEACLITIARVTPPPGKTGPLLLAHPGFGHAGSFNPILTNRFCYRHSSNFYQSPWREKEFHGLSALVRGSHGVDFTS